MIRLSRQIQGMNDLKANRRFEKFTSTEEFAMNTATMESNANYEVAVTREAPSDFEVARRVSEIRSRWSIKERVERRYEALRRFDTLLNALSDTSPAA